MGGGAKKKNGDIFASFGPYSLSLTCINWSNFHHRTAVASSLVQGVYSMQRDKTKKREPLASPWWESLGFSLAEPLINEADRSIYGAVFEYDSSKNIPHSGMPPRYVIAFRGTILKFKTRSDVIDGIRCLFDNLNKGSRCEHATQTIQTVLDKYTSDKTVSVWLAGHSLGAGIALLAGKTMAKRGSPLETFAFNPPHSSFPLEKLFENVLIKGLARFTESLIKGGLALVLSDSLTKQHDQRLAEWKPNLYVNPSDILCAEYIGDVNYKKTMADNGLGIIERAGAGVYFTSILFGIEGGEPIQHLLSANVTVNRNELKVDKKDNVVKQKWYEFKKAHGIEQWWELDPALHANWETGSKH